ncbi:MAG: STAS domain-containing protein [Clostridia bacterium]|nr:STAS domain-containing protein [Clostridia bacterium]
MTKNIIKNGNAMTIAIEGRLETTTAPEIEAVVKSELEGITDLTFDFNKLDYISSAGLRVLLAAQKIMNKQGDMKIVGANEIVKEIFDVTGFSEILTVE